jgi:hypothetical protein
MKKEIKDRLKCSWKKLAISIISLIAIIYFIITGNEISVDVIVNLLGG